MVKKLLSLLILTTVFFNSFSQNAWTLQKCIEYALENNIQIQQMVLQYEYQKESHKASMADLLPNLNARAGQNYSFGYSVDPFTNDFTQNNVKSNNVSISSSATLFSGFRKVYTIEQTKLDLKKNLKDLEKSQNDISLYIATAYLQILFNNELVRVATEQLKISEQQVERTEKLVEAGSLPKGNLLEIQSQLALEELQVINAENSLKTSYLNLLQLLDLRNPDDFEIAYPEIGEPNEKDILLPVNEIFEHAQLLPQIAGAELALKSSEKGLSIVRSYRYPTISASLSYGTGYSDAYMRLKEIEGYQTQLSGFLTADPTQTVSTIQPILEYEKYPFANQYNDNRSTTLGFSLSIPIFNGLQVETQVSKAKIGVQNSKLQLQIAKNDLYQEIQQAHNDVSSALAKYQGSKKALEAMQESFKYTTQKYNLGLVTSFDYNTAKTNLTKTESDLLQAKYEYVFKKNVLNFYRGLPIQL